MLQHLRMLTLQPNILSTDIRDKVVISDMKRSVYRFYEGIKPFELVRRLYAVEFGLSNVPLDPASIKKGVRPCIRTRASVRKVKSEPVLGLDRSAK
jgi:hypothetical protein